MTEEELRALASKVIRDFTSEDNAHLFVPSDAGFEQLSGDNAIKAVHEVLTLERDYKSRKPTTEGEDESRVPDQELTKFNPLLHVHVSLSVLCID